MAVEIASMVAEIVSWVVQLFGCGLWAWFLWLFVQQLKGKYGR